jgi:putative oxidoreductase
MAESLHALSSLEFDWKESVRGLSFEAFCSFTNSINSTRVELVRRLFFTYTEGWPGIALLLMRIAAGVTLVAPPDESLIWHGIRIISGILLVAGLWTSIVATVVAITQMWGIFNTALDPWAQLLLGGMGASLALLGPGFWSVDARLFGWKRIDFPDRSHQN